MSPMKVSSKVHVISPEAGEIVRYTEPREDMFGLFDSAYICEECNLVQQVFPISGRQLAARLTRTDSGFGCDNCGGKVTATTVPDWYNEWFTSEVPSVNVTMLLDHTPIINVGEAACIVMGGTHKTLVMGIVEQVMVSMRYDGMYEYDISMGNAQMKRYKAY